MGGEKWILSKTLPQGSSEESAFAKSPVGKPVAGAAGG